MRRLLPLVCLAAVALPAHASKTRLRLERIDSSEFSSDGVVRIFASLIELEGQIVDDRPGAAFELKLNGKRMGRPVKVQKFQGSGDPLDLVLIIESSAMYGPKPIKAPAPGTPPPAPAPKAPKGSKAAKGKKGERQRPTFHPTIQTSGDAPIDEVKRAVQQLLESMPPTWRVFVINYGEEIEPHKPFKAPGAVSDTVENLEPEGDAADLKLIEAVDAAIIELKKERASREQKGDKPARRLIVLVSDGLNYNMDKNAFRTLGKAAAKELVPIHSIAFSPQDDRGPLLNLGELSKLSNGTFRWARNVEDLKNQIETLADELSKQYVLSFKLEDESSIDKKTFQLLCGELTSNFIKFGVGAVTGNTSRGLGWWWLLIIAGVLGLVGLVLVILSRRQVQYANWDQPKGAAAPPPQQAAAAAPPQRASNAERIGDSQPAPRAAPAGAASGTVTVISGALSGTRVGIAIGQAPILVGKGPATLQILDDPTVSTRHAQVSGEPSGIVVTDLGSTNGTFVNNQRISRPTLLQDGDLVRFGNTQIKFRVG